MINRGCHMNGTDTSCLCFSYDGQCLASRGGQIHFKQDNRSIISIVQIVKAIQIKLLIPVRLLTIFPPGLSLSNFDQFPDLTVCNLLEPLYHIQPNLLQSIFW